MYLELDFAGRLSLVAQRSHVLPYRNSTGWAHSGQRGNPAIITHEHLEQMYSWFVLGDAACLFVRRTKCYFMEIITRKVEQDTHPNASMHASTSSQAGTARAHEVWQAGLLIRYFRGILSKALFVWMRWLQRSHWDTKPDDKAHRQHEGPSQMDLSLHEQLFKEN